MVLLWNQLSSLSDIAAKLDIYLSNRIRIFLDSQYSTEYNTGYNRISGTLTNIAGGENKKEKKRHYVSSRQQIITGEAKITDGGIGASQRLAEYKCLNHMNRIEKKLLENKHLHLSF